MADDAAAVLDHYGIGKAHIVGASMGGMIVQTMAIEHPDRLLSVTSIMSTVGDPNYGAAKPEAMTTARISSPLRSRSESSRSSGTPRSPTNGDEIE